MKELLGRHVNLNSVLITLFAAVFAVLADVGIKKIDGNGTELAAVAARQGIVLGRIDKIEEHMEKMVPQDEFHIEMNKMVPRELFDKEANDMKVRVDNLTLEIQKLKEEASRIANEVEQLKHRMPKT